MPPLGALRLGEITPDRVAALHHQLREKAIMGSWRTRSSTFSPLFNKAEASGYAWRAVSASVNRRCEGTIGLLAGRNCSDTQFRSEVDPRTTLVARHRSTVVAEPGKLDRTALLDACYRIARTTMWARLPSNSGKEAHPMAATAGE